MGSSESAVAAASEPAAGERSSWPSIHRTPGDPIDGKYVLVRLIGQGGMGAVWHARNLALGTDVAIKLIHPSFATDEADERLLREARAAALIEHASIVRVFDFGRTEQNEPYIVMEMLRGVSLAALFDSRGRIAASVAVQLLLPVVSALAAAHAQGIVHRDLKPDNVVLVVTSHDCVVPKVVDFGIAKLTRDAGGRSLTRGGQVMGSPEYMAPEQARGAAGVDERADVWAVCVMLYEAITGTRPFEGDNYNALMFAVVTDEPPATMEYAAGDAELWAILQKGLEKAVEKRWQTIWDLGLALARWAMARGVDVDVSGTHLDHHWCNPGRLSAILSRPVPQARSSSPAIDRASPAPQARISLPAIERASPAPQARISSPASGRASPGPQARISLPAIDRPSPAPQARISLPAIERACPPTPVSSAIFGGRATVLPPISPTRAKARRGVAIVTGAVALGALLLAGAWIGSQDHAAPPVVAQTSAPAGRASEAPGSTGRSTVEPVGGVQTAGQGPPSRLLPPVIASAPPTTSVVRAPPATATSSKPNVPGSAMPIPIVPNF